MELMEHLKVAFQTEVQLYVTETQVLPEWKKAEKNAIDMKAANDTAIEGIESCKCNNVKTPKQIKEEVKIWCDNRYNEKYEKLDSKRLKIYKEDTPTKEEAEINLQEIKAHKPGVKSLLGDILGSILIVLLIEAVFLIALFASYFGTGAQYKALLIIPLALIGIAVLIGVFIGISDFRNKLAMKRSEIHEYEKYISQYDERHPQYLREKEQLKIERDEEYEKEVARVMADREKIIKEFYDTKNERLNILKANRDQHELMVKYTSGMIAYIEESIRNMKLVLHTFYEAGFEGGKIHERYRGLIPVGMFYEYVDTERCDCLTGHGGAYNMYEDDCRAARVEQKLDKINDNMFYIGKEIKSAISNAAFAVMGANEIAANRMEAKSLDLQRDLKKLNSNYSSYNSMLESLQRDGISVHGTFELKG